MTPSNPEQTYGQSTAWQPERPQFNVFSLVVSWIATGLALMVAASTTPISTRAARSRS